MLCIRLRRHLPSNEIKKIAIIQLKIEHKCPGNNRYFTSAYHPKTLLLSVGPPHKFSMPAISSANLLAHKSEANYSLKC
jgi:hypothetical protein